MGMNQAVGKNENQRLETPTNINVVRAVRIMLFPSQAPWQAAGLALSGPALQLLLRGLFHTFGSWLITLETRSFVKG